MLVVRTRGEGTGKEDPLGRGGTVFTGSLTNGSDLASDAELMKLKLRVGTIGVNVPNGGSSKGHG